MGYGDEIMAAGQARPEATRCGGPVHILDRHGRPRWSDMWLGLDWVAPPHHGAQGSVVNGPGVRPYLKSLSRAKGAVFTEWRARDCPGAIVLTDEERDFAVAATAGLGAFVVVEPNLVPEANPNKQWGWERWAELAALIRDLNPVQLGPAGIRTVPGARHIETLSFRLACAVLARARGAVLPEGGLHHAAGVLGVPAVVIFGGHTDPETTGYPGHINLFTGGRACGAWQPCQHCAAAMAAITPAEVEAALRGTLVEKEIRPNPPAL